MSGDGNHAVERATAMLEAEADRWIADWPDYSKLVEILSQDSVSGPRVPAQVVKRLKTRQRDLIDRLVRAAYMEGFYNGGMSRKAHDEAARGK